MADFPRTSSGRDVPPLFVHSFGSCSPVVQARQSAGSATISMAASLTWVADLCIYIPMTLPWDYPVSRVFWVNGVTITSTDASFAIYSDDGTRIYTTGAVAMSGAGNNSQYVTPSTPFVLSAGSYFFAWSCNNSTNRVAGTGSLTALAQRGGGIFQEASAHPAPATPTFAAAAQAVYPFCGVTSTTTGF